MSRDAVKAYIGLGSNLADPLEQVRRAIEELSAIPETRRVAVSRLYRSNPMGPPGQPDYINAVVALSTALAPEALLDALQAIERQHLRTRGERWGPRTLDLDILLYGRRAIASARLTVPHPGLAERAFVLCPLAEIAPELRLPNGDWLSELLRRCPPDGLTALPEPGRG